MEALEGHQRGIDGVGAGLDVGAGGDVLGRLVVITTTITVLIGRIRHCKGMPRLRAGARRLDGVGRRGVLVLWLCECGELVATTSASATTRIAVGARA